MTAIPARIAGVGEICLVTPSRDGRLHPLIAAAAELGGVNRIFKIGGAQAIAALAFGTASIPRVDKIVGPGNAYVAAAKKMVFGQVAIDMIAGPSEVLIIADGTGDAAHAAADLLAQAEHDEMAGAVLLTPDEAFAGAVDGEVDRQLASLPRKEIASRALAAFGALVVTRDLAEAVALANRFAPEHLELMVQTPGSSSRGSGMPGRSFWECIRRRRWATTWRDPTMCCRPGERPVSPLLSAFTILSSGPASSLFRGMHSNGTGVQPPVSPKWKGSTDTAIPSVCAWKKQEALPALQKDLDKMVLLIKMNPRFRRPRD